MSKLYVENSVQQALMECELKGQFSDGYWENAYNTGWKDWTSAEVVVAEEDQPTGRNFYATKDNFNISAKELLECVGDRMILYARLALAGFAVKDIKMLEYTFGNPSKNADGKFVFERRQGPTYKGEYYDKVRAKIAQFNTELLNKLDLVAENTSFDMKELKHQLFLLKKVMKRTI